MSNQTYNSPYFSLLKDIENHKIGQGMASSEGTMEPSKANSSSEPMMSQSTISAGIKGAQAGGLSGALMAGGVNSLLTSGAAAGGPYAIAGGLLLSELQAAQEAKAQAEAQRIENEKNRMANMQSQLNAQSRTVFKV